MPAIKDSDLSPQCGEGKLAQKACQEKWQFGIEYFRKVLTTAAGKTTIRHCFGHFAARTMIVRGGKVANETVRDSEAGNCVSF